MLTASASGAVIIQSERLLAVGLVAISLRVVGIPGGFSA